VTVVAGDAWWAEALAKAAFLAGPSDGAQVVRDAGAAGLLIDLAGHRYPAGGIEGFLL
jgi:thiamine biosynthesis lipoprotein